MTSPLRRKRLITARGRNTLTRTAASLLGIGLFLAGGAVHAQQSSSSPILYGKWRQPAPELTPVPPVPTSSVVPVVTGPVTPRVSPTGTTLSYHKAPELPSEPIQRSSFQAQDTKKTTGTTSSYGADDLQAPIPLGLREGGPNPVVQLESEENFDRRIAQKVRQTLKAQTPNTQTSLPDRAIFPEEPVVSREKYVPRAFPASSLLVEPNYVCYGRLYFQERNAERYGWDLGMVQPLVSSGVFFFDVATLPYHWGANLCKGPACSAGQCLPGDPVPYLLYPPELSLTGGVSEVVAIAGLLAIFP